MNEHHFNVEVAKIVGVEEAVLFHNICYWTELNEANENNFHDGDYWTYNSKSAFAELFPYWTERQIGRIIKNLLDYGLIKIGNFNAVKYDQTHWYAITEYGKSIILNGKSHCTKPSDGSNETVRPIPDIKPDIKPIKKHNDRQDNLICYGEYNNVFLTQDEYDKINDDLGRIGDLFGVNMVIDFFSRYLENNPKKQKQYKNHYSCYNSWVRTAFHEDLAKRKRAEDTLNGVSYGRK